MYTCIDKTMQIVLERGSIDGMPNTYACKGVSNPNVPIFPPRVCTLVLFILLEISRRTRWWCLKCVIVYLAQDILPFVMYCVNGKPRSSLLIESVDSMIYSSICG